MYTDQKAAGKGGISEANIYRSVSEIEGVGHAYNTLFEKEEERNDTRFSDRYVCVIRYSKHSSEDLL